MARISQTGYEDYTTPSWAGDYFDRESLLPGGVILDVAAFTAIAGVPVAASANALAAATSISVTATTQAMPSGTILRFGSGKYAKLTAAAAVGATSLTVEALGVAITSGDTAYYNSTGLVQVVNGTLVGRTFAERESGTAFGPAVDTDDEFFIVAHDILDLTSSPEATIYRPGRVVKENFLPQWASLTSGMKAKLRATYRTTKGAN